MELIPGRKAARKGVVCGRNELVERVMEKTRDEFRDGDHSGQFSPYSWQAVVVNSRLYPKASILNSEGG